MFVDINNPQIETFFHDTTVEEGVTYLYRVQSWTILGRSGWSEAISYKHHSETSYLSQCLSFVWNMLFTSGIGGLVFVIVHYLLNTYILGRQNAAPVETEKTDGTAGPHCIAQPPPNPTAVLPPPNDGSADATNSTATEALGSSNGVSMSPRALGTPRNVHAQSGDTEIRLNWECGAQPQCFVISCRVRDEERTFRLNPNVKAYTISRLENGQTYRVKVTAVVDEHHYSSSPVEAMPLPDQRRNTVDKCNWCRQQLRIRWHVCRECDSSFCPEHGKSSGCIRLLPCRNCVCKYCLLAK
eukprot:c8380_g1_i2.p1 GENE.c8380_g1_i2~~c8380_g1_i2.p1  ORF type:complete len:298 (-),score=63.38 c8380_g1_i2:90-983(-)